jgi:hypothetical protein
LDDKNVRLTKVSVWESENSKASYLPWKAHFYARK